MNKRIEYRWIERTATSVPEIARFVFDENNMLIGLSTFGTEFVDPNQALKEFYNYKLTTIKVPNKL